MEPLLVSTALVALAEMGDKTQLLALLLSMRFGRPWPIAAGILVATLLNHALAGAAGAWLTGLIGPAWLKWILGLSFMLMGAWMLIPDKQDEDAVTGEKPRFGVFGTTLMAFFLAEMGDKTQIATVMLAARFPDWAWVVAGTTLGMMLANVPVVWLGNRLVRRIPIRMVHLVTGGIFAALGCAMILGWGS